MPTRKRGTRIYKKLECRFFFSFLACNQVAGWPGRILPKCSCARWPSPMLELQMDGTMLENGGDSTITTTPEYKLTYMRESSLEQTWQQLVLWRTINGITPVDVPCANFHTFSLSKIYQGTIARLQATNHVKYNGLSIAKWSFVSMFPCWCLRGKRGFHWNP